MKRWSDFFTDNSTGGAPFFNQDFYDIQQEFYDAINPTIQNLGKQITSDGNYVVDGLEVTPNGPDWDIAAGIVSLGGELYRFNGATAVTSGTKYLAIAADVITNRNYKNGGSKPFFLTKEAEVLSSTSGGAEIVFDPENGNPFLNLGNLPYSKGELTILRKDTIEGAVLEGCVVTDGGGGTFDVSAGIVFMNDDFYIVPEGTGLTNPSFIISGSGNTAEYTATEPTSGQYIAIRYVTDNGWTKTTDAFGPLENGWAEVAPTSNPLEFKKNIDGTISWRGKIDPTSATNEEVYELSSVYGDATELQPIFSGGRGVTVFDSFAVSGTGLAAISFWNRIAATETVTYDIVVNCTYPTRKRLP